ncbi:MAG: hypothetical protein IVW55_12940 [Chloroflexi bacterium]|nr:hypothetical protein [Chloroflexota bacterium]
MATKNKGTSPTKKGSAQIIEPAPQQHASGAAQPAQSPSPQRQAASAVQATPTIRKGIYLSALVYIEGDQAAPDDFTALASSALESALSGDHSGLSITLKKVDVQNNVEDNADENNSAAPKPEKFQF